MKTTETRPRLTSLAPQFLVDDLARSIAITGASTNIWTPRPASRTSRRSTRSASRTARPFGSRWRRPRGEQRTFTSKTRTATSSRSGPFTPQLSAPAGFG